jgi:hypothetical protein
MRDLVDMTGMLIHQTFELNLKVNEGRAYNSDLTDFYKINSGEDFSKVKKEF